MAERASVVVLGLFLFQFVALGCLMYIVIDTRNELAAFKDGTKVLPNIGLKTERKTRQAESKVFKKLEETFRALSDSSLGTEEERITLASLLLEDAILHLFIENTEAVFNCSYDGIDKDKCGPALGPKGDSGTKGERGLRGRRGHQGDMGEIGAPGNDGLPGASGRPGLHGRNGEKGSKGEKGVSGERGLNGLKGSKGSIGQAVLKGSKGDSGQSGEKGYIGGYGLKGVRGNIGPKGIKGDIGPKGLKGYRGTYGLKGDSGVGGPKGSVGDIGPKGLKGHRGTYGLKGDSGLPGPKGSVGDIGFKGFKGTYGPRGDSGLPGPKGSVGDIGPKGFKGFKGTYGPRGDSGLPGPKGSKGLGLLGDIGSLCTTTCQNGGTCDLNLPPSTCSCPPGWTGPTCSQPVLGHSCTIGTHNCQQICQPNGSSFHCACREGLVLNPDGRTCRPTTTCPDGYWTGSYCIRH